MTLGDHYVEEIGAAGRTLKATPWALDPVSDIAVLGALDDQEFSAEEKAFLAFCESVRAVPVSRQTFEIFEPFPVWISTHKGPWVEAQAQQCSPQASQLSVTAREQIEPGTSGSPVIDEKGQLLGVVSQFSAADGDRSCVGMIPMPWYTLPAWIAARIEAA